MVCILLNMLQLAMSYDEASSDYTFTLEVINIIFTAIFTIEAAIKIIGFNFRPYISDAWNCFDFFVVLASLSEFVI